MRSQKQSPFFTKLPLDIRSQIQEEYIVEYLRFTAFERRDFDPLMSQVNLTESCCTSVLLSPLTLCCKRMYHEMRRDTGQPENGGTFGLIVLCVKPDFCKAHLGLAVEGSFRWDSLRRLRFVNELEAPERHLWLELLSQLMELAPNLTEIVMEWNPKMSLFRELEDKDAAILRMIEDHPSIRTVRLRGNTPRSWLGWGSMVGKKLIIEPSMWVLDDQEDDEEVERMQNEGIRQKRSLVQRPPRRRLIPPALEEYNQDTRTRRLRKHLEFDALRKYLGRLLDKIRP